MDNFNSEAADEIFIAEEEGFTDIVAAIKDAVKEGNRYILKCGGNFEGMEVEAELDIPERFEAGIVGNEANQKAFTEAFLLLKGEKGHNFAKMFSEVYGVESNRIKNSDIKRAITVFPLMEKRSSVEKNPIYTKIFFDDRNEREEYCELFLNISLEDKVIEFNEKDNEYRVNIIKNLSR